jgi:hypothetical protein
VASGRCNGDARSCLGRLSTKVASESIYIYYIRARPFVEQAEEGGRHDVVTDNGSYVMARTFRRRQQRHEYRWVLRRFEPGVPYPGWISIDARTAAGRRAIALFHSDKTVTMNGSAPRWFRKVFDHRIRTANDRMFRRWLADPSFDPVFLAWHKHGANWAWW